MKKDRSKQLEPTEKQKRIVKDNAGILDFHNSLTPFEKAFKKQLKIESALNTQVGGDHYIKHTIRPWDIIDEYDLGYYGGNALKYLLRDKGDRKEDLEKARHYIAKMIGDLVNANNS
tara:strand:+ start:1775 stop:2125 length:351 start_codon:yes stop_codon:yes gene_type:complete